MLPEQVGPGRPKKFCSQSCRQWDWVHRQRAAELELSDNELIVARDALDRLRDDLYVLGCAVDDAERDLESGRLSAAELRITLEWLLDAARTASSTRLAPGGP